MMYPEALLHPEVDPLDEGFCSLLLTLAQCSFNPTASASHLAIGSNSTGRGLFSLTLSVKSFYQSALVKVYQEVILLDVAYVH